MGDFRQLRVWKKAKDLAVLIYQITTKNATLSKDYRFKDQIRSAAVSVPSNIAEGDELDTNKQSIRHFYIAKGSTAEIITQIIIAQEIGHIPQETANQLISDYEHISLMLAKLIKARSASQHKT